MFRVCINKNNGVDGRLATTRFMMDRMNELLVDVEIMEYAVKYTPKKLMNDLALPRTLHHVDIYEMSVAWQRLIARKVISHHEKEGWKEAWMGNLKIWIDMKKLRQTSGPKKPLYCHKCGRPSFMFTLTYMMTWTHEWTNRLHPEGFMLCPACHFLYPDNTVDMIPQSNIEKKLHDWNVRDARWWNEQRQKRTRIYLEWTRIGHKNPKAELLRGA